MSEVLRPGPLARLRTVGVAAADRLRQVPGWRFVEPHVGRLLRRRRHAAVLAPYIDMRAPLRRITRLVFPPVLGFLGLVYGFYFALTAPFLMVPFAAPVALLLILSIWALPASHTVPMRTAEFFFAAFIVGLLLWPNYLALSLPGLPWITMIRITGVPMAVLFLVSLSMSSEFRGKIRELLAAVDPFWKLVVIFIVMGLITLPFSKTPADALSKFIINQINWTCVLLVAAYICREPGRARRYLAIMVLTVLPMIWLSTLESQQKQVLWRNSIPSFLKIEDPAVLTMLSGHMRTAAGIYRVKAIYGEALGLAEYYALLVPFLIHTAVMGRRWLKPLALLSLPVIFYYVRLTDSRIGVVGFLISFTVYFILWAVLRFRRARGDLFSATLVYSAPLFMGFFMLAVMAIPPLNALVFGDGSTAASNAARQQQMMIGVPAILANPIGRATAGAGAVMDGNIDNYFLAVGIDYGVVGLTAFWGFLLLAIVLCSRYGTSAVTRKDPEILLLIPIAAVISEFFMIKSVYSNQPNHPLVFMMLGMMVALVWRAKMLESAELQRRIEVAAAPPNRGRHGQVHLRPMVSAGSSLQ